MFEIGSKINNLKLIKKVLYKSRSCDKWGEYELDWVFFANIENVEVKNIDEVNNLEWVSLEELDGWIELKLK